MAKGFANEGRVVLLVVVSAFGTVQVAPRMTQCPCEPHPICLCLSWSRAHQSLNATLPASVFIQQFQEETEVLLCA